LSRAENYIKKTAKINSDYILVLPSWYPSKLDRFNGDFNERLVHAVGNYKTQIVIYVSTKKQNSLKDIEIFEKENIITYKAYFLYSKLNVINVFRMFRLYLKIFAIVFKECGLPLLVHNYVFFPSGLASVYLKHRYKLKVVLTEHWSLFNYSNNANHIYNQSLYKRIIYHRILNCFDATISVSESLSTSVSEWTKKAKRYILPNVVDVEVFNTNKIVGSANKTFTYIHVSNIGIHKNVESILEVLHIMLKKGIKVNLTLIGNRKENIMEIIDKNALLKQHVNFLGEVSYNEVAEWMKKSDAFILFSKYENMPCVILEALCCGLPVISSNVGGIANVVKAENGILVESGNKKQLEEAMGYLIENYHRYDTDQISAEAIKTYNYKNIGKRTNEIYLETLA